ncbi:MAG: hypothetical protein MUD14_20435 [Hydrococcus sp. Prado102]|jgi:hypothetical protein|nr:hypothetical protein [Hydrococcus sp. Prado102]
MSVVTGSGTHSNTDKRFRIVMSTVGAPGFKKSTETYEVSFAQLSQKIQNIHRMGGKILSITEIG